jgi:hypothetical protein
MVADMVKLRDPRRSALVGIAASSLLAMASAAGILYPFRHHQWALLAFPLLGMILVVAYVAILVRFGE